MSEHKELTRDEQRIIYRALRDFTLERNSMPRDLAELSVHLVEDHGLADAKRVDEYEIEFYRHSASISRGEISIAMTLGDTLENEDARLQLYMLIWRTQNTPEQTAVYRELIVKK